MSKEQGNKLNRLEDLGIQYFCEDRQVWDGWALRALGVLLENADLEEFIRGNDAESLRVGLRKIIEMYLERQERKVNELRLNSINSYEHVIQEARGVYEQVNQGAFVNAGVALQAVRGALAGVALVIAECGDEYPSAQVIRGKLLTLTGELVEKKGA